MTIRIILLLAILLNANMAFAGTNFTDLISTLSIYDVSTLSSSSPVNKNEYDRRQKLLKKIEEIQKQFDDEERRLTMGMSKDEIEEMYRHAMDVLAGAMVVSSSTIIN